VNDLAAAAPAPGLATRLSESWLRSAPVRFLFILGQLGLLTIIIRQFQIESSAFLRIALLVFAGYAVHSVVPIAYRLPFFVLLSLGGIVLVMGLQTGAVLIAVGLALITICHLPLSIRTRVVVLLVVGGGLAIARAGTFEVPWSAALWPILASMFMFRLIVYMYDLKHDKAPTSLWRTLAYFFLLPNVCFPLFPVVDFKTFRRTYYDKQAFQIHQVGVNWMVRGITHLLLYRIFYQYAALAPSEVVTAGDLVQYLVVNFLLYLRVSGQFHVIVGMLHLFGFNLPETNRRYFLASSFTDHWRRINIYWKDFMMKVFYYPAYFKLRKLGETKAIILATLFAFGVTWFLHSYQWFWLRGSFPVAWQDGVFWTILAILVIATLLYEMKYGRKRVLSASTWTSRSFAVRTIKTLSVFVVIIVLWSLWNAESWEGWLTLWTPLEALVAQGGQLAPLVLFVAVVGNASGAGLGTTSLLGERARAVASTLIVLVFLTLVGLPQFYTKLGPEAASFILSIKSNRLSRNDRAALQRGYYEDLMRVNRFNSQLWEVYMNKPLHWLDVQDAGLVRFTADFAQSELAPSLISADSFSTITTNRWGMRDKDYEREPAPDSYRMALLGASATMGWGVEDGETYEALVEEALNRDLGDHGGYARYEILNLGVPGYYPLQQAVAVEKALSFKPRVVLYEATGQELSRATYYLAEVNRKGVAIPYPELRALAERAGLEPGMSEDEAQKRLMPFQREILGWLYAYLVNRIRAEGALAVWFFLPQIYSGSWEETVDPAKQLAEENGFTTIDLRGVYTGRNEEELRLVEWDKHPNALGHRLLAQALYREIRAEENRFGLRP